MKNVEFKSNAGLKNKYCLVVGPNGSGKTTLLKEVYKASKNAVFIGDGSGESFLLNDREGINPQTFETIKSFLDKYELIPESFRIAPRGETSYFRDYFDYDLYRNIVEVHGEFVGKDNFPREFLTKRFIRSRGPLDSWYLVQKFKDVYPTNGNNIFLEIDKLNKLQFFGYSHGLQRNLSTAEYILASDLDGKSKAIIEVFVKICKENKQPYRNRVKWPLGEVLFNKKLSLLSDAGLILIHNNKKLSAGQKRIFRMLAKASSKGVKNQVIIIDEIELNLHPLWLYEIVEFIDNIFINSNILISTHSPMIISGFETDNILPLSYGNERWEIRSENYGKNSSWILREVMGLKHTFASHAKDFVVKRANDSIRQMEKIKNEKINKK